jgi:hypothetical protein
MSVNDMFSPIVNTNKNYQNQHYMYKKSKVGTSGSIKKSKKERDTKAPDRILIAQEKPSLNGDLSTMTVKRVAQMGSIYQDHKKTLNERINFKVNCNNDEPSIASG